MRARLFFNIILLYFFFAKKLSDFFYKKETKRVSIVGSVDQNHKINFLKKRFPRITYILN